MFSHSRIIFLIAMLCSGCAFLQPAAPTPWLPAQVATQAAVAVEDLVEDQELDAIESSPLETLSDVVNAPANLFAAGLATNVTVWWSVWDWLVGIEPNPQERSTQVNEWLGPRMASAPPLPRSAPSPTPSMDAWRRERGTIPY